MFRRRPQHDSHVADVRRWATHPPEERRPDRRRAPNSPNADVRATDHAIERLFAVLGR